MTPYRRPLNFVVIPIPIFLLMSWLWASFQSNCVACLAHFLPSFPDMVNWFVVPVVVIQMVSIPLSFSLCWAICCCSRCERKNETVIVHAIWTLCQTIKKRVSICYRRLLKLLNSYRRLLKLLNSYRSLISQSAVTNKENLRMCHPHVTSDTRICLFECFWQNADDHQNLL